MLKLGLNPGYVLDEMQEYEISSILKYGYMKHQDSWEQCRMMSYITAQVNSTKQLSPDKIMKFDWDSAPQKEMTKEEIEAKFREGNEMAKRLADKMHKQPK